MRDKIRANRSGDLQVATASPRAWRRKRNRLARENYLGNHAFQVTVTTTGRIRHLADEAWVRYCEEQLASAAQIEGFTLLAYVLMPDHLHILASGSEGSDLSFFIKRFKQETSFSFKQRTGEPLWQKGFYDHVVRRDEDPVEIALYVAGNPVRAGLVEDWTDYPYVGGTLLLGAKGGDLKVATTGDSARPEALEA